MKIKWHSEDDHQPLNSITSITFSPDGLYVLAGVRHFAKGWRFEYHDDHDRRLSGNSEYFAYVWNSATGEKIQCLSGHGKSFNLIAASPDGRRILTAHEYCTVYLWDIETGEELLQLTDHVGKIEFADFSRDGRRISSGSVNYSCLSDASDKPRQLCHVWDSETGEELQQLKERFILFSPDNKKILIKKDNSIQLRNAETGVGLYRIFPYPDGWLTVYPDSHYRLWRC